MTANVIHKKCNQGKNVKDNAFAKSIGEGTMHRYTKCNYSNYYPYDFEDVC